MKSTLISSSKRWKSLANLLYFLTGHSDIAAHGDTLAISKEIYCSSYQIAWSLNLRTFILLSKVQSLQGLRSRVILLFVLIFNFMLSYNYVASDASAQSSSYMRQVIEDPIGDIMSPFTKNATWKPVTYMLLTSTCNRPRHRQQKC